jgi:hypothetical protein
MKSDFVVVSGWGRKFCWLMVWLKYEGDLMWLLFEKRWVVVVVGFWMKGICGDDVVDDFWSKVVGMLDEGERRSWAALGFQGGRRVFVLGTARYE